MTSKLIDDKRQKILLAAGAVVADVGLQGLSMQKLAKEAGVAAGTIYRYFDDKEHLIKELRLHVAQSIADVVQKNVDESMPLKIRYRQMWLNIWNLVGSDIAMLKNRIQYDSTPIANCSTSQQDEERGMFNEVFAFFAQGKEQGIFKQLDNELLSALSLETSVTLARKHTFGQYQLSDDAIEAAINASWDAIINH
ncbi:TetR/AcrR family transcriptional regulator [Vibrio genomosp. F10]|uniref:TetR family transcriptional regulator n=2 Tax=Vibrio genomosp. F10 TaxID=723171 RepID=A0A1B9R2U8_9VIBR|nr:TetR/AcrR family transcriptional regulator [Vibrio genomosp. F10]OCH78531.1 TetR family transcriptional regulator [Vibrio genomosp. F10]OEE37204.1 TetR family transcriptional regulator [Vibrio genomosp. F10 str. ZF-129]OEE94517.1 TetR family transcriptional regulator [Vibrio genomosp. F10 str. 9ZC157]OEF07056.1 TetR family transcriptional regulator [Vibrio genomosp. F10 str. 9ZB36]OEF18630.1 TetR family transcriptional regulator [Vibrio genomosp. F10 str. 9ZD137]